MRATDRIAGRRHGTASLTRLGRVAGMVNQSVRVSCFCYVSFKLYISCYFWLFLVYRRCRRGVASSIMPKESTCVEHHIVVVVVVVVVVIIIQLIIHMCVYIYIYICIHIYICERAAGRSEGAGGFPSPAACLANQVHWHRSASNPFHSSK